MSLFSRGIFPATQVHLALCSGVPPTLADLRAADAAAAAAASGEGGADGSEAGQSGLDIHHAQGECRHAHESRAD